MAPAHAAFDRWWNGISLRAKITGVTVLLLTFGLAVAGAGTTTVLRSYLLDQQDQKVRQLSATLSSGTRFQLSCKLVDWDTSGLLQAIVTSGGTPYCTNLPDSEDQPDLSSLDIHRVADLNRNPTTVSGAHGSSWRVVAIPVSTNDGSVYSVVIGANMSQTDSTIARFILIFFGFAIAVAGYWAFLIGVVIVEIAL